MISRPGRIKGVGNALALGAVTLVAGLTPPPPGTISAWVAPKCVVTAESGSPFPGKWSNELTPHLVEPIYCMSPSHFSREVTLKKAGQIAGSLLICHFFNSIGHQRQSGDAHDRSIDAQQADIGRRGWQVSSVPKAVMKCSGVRCRRLISSSNLVSA